MQQAFKTSLLQLLEESDIKVKYYHINIKKNEVSRIVVKRSNCYKSWQKIFTGR